MQNIITMIIPSLSKITDFFNIHEDSIESKLLQYLMDNMNNNIGKEMITDIFNNIFKPLFSQITDLKKIKNNSIQYKLLYGFIGKLSYMSSDLFFVLKEPQTTELEYLNIHKEMMDVFKPLASQITNLHTIPKDKDSIENKLLKYEISQLSNKYVSIEDKSDILKNRIQPLSAQIVDIENIQEGDIQDMLIKGLINGLSDFQQQDSDIKSELQEQITDILVNNGINDIDNVQNVNLKNYIINKKDEISNVLDKKILPRPESIKYYQYGNKQYKEQKQAINNQQYKKPQQAIKNQQPIQQAPEPIQGNKQQWGIGIGIGLLIIIVGFILGLIQYLQRNKGSKAISKLQTDVDVISNINNRDLERKAAAAA